MLCYVILYVDVDEITTIDIILVGGRWAMESYGLTGMQCVLEWNGKLLQVTIS